jgi:hypothetical protein
MNELDVVELIDDLPVNHLKAGTEGTIVHVYTDGAAFEVEFFSDTGDTLDVLTVTPEQVRLVWSPEPVFAANELVVLRKDLPEYGLIAGDTGHVTQVRLDESIYVIDFATMRGQTVAVVELEPKKVRRVGEKEMMHVRSMGR